MVLSKETRLGMRATSKFNIIVFMVFLCCFAVNSFLELVEYIFKIPGVEVFLSERFSQDTLEKLFGWLRQRGKSHENPNMEQFCKGTQAFRVINGTCKSVKRGNCRGNKTEIDWEQENCPLPKRKRPRLTSVTGSSCKVGDSNEHKPPASLKQTSKATKAVPQVKPEIVVKQERLTKLADNPERTTDLADKPGVDKPAKRKRIAKRLAKPAGLNRSRVVKPLQAIQPKQHLVQVGHFKYWLYVLTFYLIFIENTNAGRIQE